MGAEVVADALAFVAAEPARPFFAWLHLFDAHGPYKPPSPPAPYLTRYATDEALRAWLAARRFAAQVADHGRTGVDVAAENNLYDGALRFLDDQLAPLFARLAAPDLRESTAVVIVADHGTGMGQHDDLSHGVCWDEQLRVPLLLRVPGTAPAVVDTPLSTLDLWPTLARLAPGLLDEGFLAQVAGRDALAADFDERPRLAVSAAMRGLAAVTSGRFKLIRGQKGQPRLFDLEADPHELVNVAGRHPEVVERLTAWLERELARLEKRSELHRKGATAPEGVVDAALLEELKALGYTEQAEAPAEDGERDGGGG